MRRAPILNAATANRIEAHTQPRRGWYSYYTVPPGRNQEEEIELLYLSLRKLASCIFK